MVLKITKLDKHLITSKKCFLFYNIDSKRKRKIFYGTATQVNKSALGGLQ